MKKLLLATVMAFMGFGAMAHAQEAQEEVQPQSVQAQQDDQMMAESRARLVWTCGMNFTGTSKGFKVIIGKFSTVAYGHLSCVDGRGETYDRRIKLTMGTHWIGPAIGAGYFRFQGSAAEISLVNMRPSVLFGDYLAGQGNIGVILGAGAFTAVKVGTPQLALNISAQLLEGTGIQLGFHELRIEKY